MEANASFKKRPREETTENPQNNKEESSASNPESLTQDLAKQQFNKNNVVKEKGFEWFSEVSYKGILPTDMKLSNEQISDRLLLGIHQCRSHPRSKIFKSRSSAKPLIINRITERNTESN